MGAPASQTGLGSAEAPEPHSGLRPSGAIPRAAGVEGYREGTCRNWAAYGRRVTTHTYAMMDDGELWPMCGYGWNRSDGHRFSIFRNAPGTEGSCKLCRENVAAGKPPVTDGFPHKTKWM